MNVHLRDLAARQDDIVAAWQLMLLGWTWKRVASRAQAGGWRTIHQGVYALSQSPLTRRQRLAAAVLTAPNTFLATASAGDHWGFRAFDRRFETVVRAGSGGPKQIGNLVVLRSTALDGNTTRHQGLPVTTAARTLIDLSPHLNAKQRGRAFRDAIRLKTVTVTELDRALRAHPGRRGTAPLADLCRRYADIPYARTRSDAEGLKLEQIVDVGKPLPDVNVLVNGVEADLVDHGRREILEVDGPQFHLFPDEEERKTAAWKRAGYSVRRISSDDVYGA